MIRISSQALDPPPSVRSHSDQWAVEAPPRRRALALACVGAVLGMAGSLLVFMRLGAAPLPERPVAQATGRRRSWRSPGRRRAGAGAPMRFRCGGPPAVDRPRRLAPAAVAARRGPGGCGGAHAGGLPAGLRP